MSKERNQEAYERGIEDGKNAGPLDEFVHAVSSSWFHGEEDKAYKAGWDQGIKDKSK